MAKEKKQREKTRLHARNKNRDPYDLAALIKVKPELNNHVKLNKYGNESVDFSNSEAVKILNQALLHHYYEIEHWDFPKQNLCPPIPGRADYIHYMADVLCENNFGKFPAGEKITCLDVGVGANCIYPMIGVTEYGWNFIGSDIDPASIASAKNIVDANPSLKGKIDIRLQENPKDIFYGVIKRSDKIDLSICNPPFHASAQEAMKGTARKVTNLSGNKTENPTLNFSGVSNELYCDGGEARFIQNMVKQSKKFSENCYWFSTLVSKQSNLKGIYQLLEKLKATRAKTVPLGTGNKSSRIVVWTFLTKEEELEWRTSRWGRKIKSVN